MKITKKQLKQIIEEELTRLAEGDVIPMTFKKNQERAQVHPPAEVIPTDFQKNPYKGAHPDLTDDSDTLSPAETVTRDTAEVKKAYHDVTSSFKGMMMMIEDTYLDAESIVEYARQNRLEDVEQIEADMLGITNGLMSLIQGFVK